MEFSPLGNESGLVEYAGTFSFKDIVLNESAKKNERFSVVSDLADDICATVRFNAQLKALTIERQSRGLGVDSFVREFNEYRPGFVDCSL